MLPGRPAMRGVLACSGDNTSRRDESAVPRERERCEARGVRKGLASAESPPPLPPPSVSSRPSTRTEAGALTRAGRGGVGASRGVP